MRGLLCLALATTTAFVPPSTTRQHLVLHATTPSGIVYEDIEVGEGKTANAGDYVSVIYETRLNGKVIDATGGGEAKVMSTGVQGAGDRPWAQFAVGKGKVIKGWELGLAAMSLGQRCRLTISAEAGYGKRGCQDKANASGTGVIPPQADLIFDVALLDINDQRGVATEAKLGAYAKTLDEWVAGMKRMGDDMDDEAFEAEVSKWMTTLSKNQRKAWRARSLTLNSQADDPLVTDLTNKVKNKVKNKGKYGGGAAITDYFRSVTADSQPTRARSTGIAQSTNDPVGICANGSGFNDTTTVMKSH